VKAEKAKTREFGALELKNDSFFYASNCRWFDFSQITQYARQRCLPTTACTKIRLLLSASETVEK